MKLLVRPYLDLILLLLIFLFPHIAPTASQGIPHNYTTSGAYRIVYCHAHRAVDEFHPSEAFQLKLLLPIIWISLQSNLLHDITLGVSSAHGYSAFFKVETALIRIDGGAKASQNNSNIEAARQVYQDIADGPDVLVEGPRGQHRLSPPTILCANNGDRETPRQQEACQNSIGHNKRVVARVEQGLGTVELCPLFFHLPRLPTLETCPAVDRATNTFDPADDGRQLGRNQFSVLVHEIAHVYLREKGFVEADEVYGLRETVNLNASASVANPMNFAFYAAAVQAGCTDFPIPEPKPDG